MIIILFQYQKHNEQRNCLPKKKTNQNHLVVLKIQYITVEDYKCMDSPSIKKGKRIGKSQERSKKHEHELDPHAIFMHTILYDS